MVVSGNTSITSNRKLRERLARRQSILAVARERFLESGITATTMDDIARAAELAKGTLYLHFGSKDEIAFSLLVDATDRLLSVLREVVQDSAPAVDHLERIAVAYHHFFRSEPEAFRYMFILPHQSYSGRVPQALLDEWAVSSRAALALVESLLEQGVTEGDLDIPEPWPAAISFWSAITGVIAVPSQEVRQPFLGPVDTERLVIETVRAFMRGMHPSCVDKRGASTSDGC